MEKRAGYEYRRKLRRQDVVLGVLGASLALATACSDNGAKSMTNETIVPSQPATSSDTSIPLAATPEEVRDLVLREVQPCTQIDPRSGISRALGRTGIAIVDGRCWPQDPDAPIGRYFTPRQSAPGTAPIKDKTGTILHPSCVVSEGMLVSNGREQSSHWVQAAGLPGDPRPTFIPEIWVQHGGLPDCNDMPVTQK